MSLEFFLALPFQRFLISPLLLFIIVLTLPVIVCTAPSAVAQSGELLKATIQKQGFLNPSSDNEQFGGGAPGLTRKDMSRGSRSITDPFDNGNSEQGEAGSDYGQRHLQIIIKCRGWCSFPK